MKRRVIQVVISLMMLVALSALHGLQSSWADAGQHGALIGKWKGVKDGAGLVFVNDGSWALSDGTATLSGNYVWTGDTNIKLGFSKDGVAMEMVWQVQVDGDVLQVVESPGKAFKYVRVAATSTATPPSTRDGTTLASVTIDSVVIAPFDSGGMKWDGGKATAEEFRWVSDQTRKLAEKRVNTATTVAAITAFALRVAAGYFEPPDAKGTVQMIFDGKAQPAIALPKISNQYTPRWPGLTWQHLALDHDVKIRFVLDDDDPDKSVDDHIGTAVITSADLLAAAKNGKTFSVNVADQPNGLILAVNVFVVIE